MLYDLKMLDQHVKHMSDLKKEDAQGIKKAKILHNLVVVSYSKEKNHVHCLFLLLSTYIQHSFFKEDNLYIQMVGYIKEFSLLTADKNSYSDLITHQKYTVPAIGLIIDILIATYKTNRDSDVLMVLQKIKNLINKMVSMNEPQLNLVCAVALKDMRASLSYHLDLIPYYVSNNVMLTQFLSQNEFYVYSLTPIKDSTPASAEEKCLRYLMLVKGFAVNFYESIRLRQNKKSTLPIGFLNIHQDVDFVEVFDFIFSQENMPEKFQINMYFKFSWNIFDKLAIDVLKVLNICTVTINEYLLTTPQNKSLVTASDALWNNIFSTLTLKQTLILLKIRAYKEQKMKPYIKEDVVKSHLEALFKDLSETSSYLNDLWIEKCLKFQEHEKIIETLKMQQDNERRKKTLGRIPISAKVNSGMSQYSSEANTSAGIKTESTSNIYTEINNLIVNKHYEEAEALCLSIKGSIDDIYYQMCLGDIYFSWGKAELGEVHYKECIQLITAVQSASKVQDKNLEDLKIFLESYIKSEKETHSEIYFEPQTSSLNFETSATRRIPYTIDLPIWLVEIISTIELYAFEIHLIGGRVRDHIMSKPADDYDLVTSAPLMKVKEILESINIGNGKIIGIKHPVYVLNKDDQIVQISSLTTYRNDASSYPCTLENGVMVTQNIASSIEEDVVHRDFSCNAIYYDHTNKILRDPCNGYDDIMHKRIKFINESKLAIKNDPVLIFRAIRTYVKCNFPITDDFSSLVLSVNHELKTMLFERINHEITKSLSLKNSASVIKLFKKYNILKICFDMTDAQQYETIVFLKNIKSNRVYPLMWAAILHSKFENEIILSKNINGDPVKAVEEAKKILKKYGVLNEHENEITAIWMLHYIEMTRKNDLYNNIVITNQTHNLALEYISFRMMAIRSRQGKSVGKLSIANDLYENKCIKEQLPSIKNPQKSCQLFSLNHGKNISVYLYAIDLSENALVNFNLVYNTLLSVVKLLKKSKLILHYEHMQNIFTFDCDSESNAFKVQSMLEKYLFVGVLLSDDLVSEYKHHHKLTV